MCSNLPCHNTAAESHSSTQCARMHIDSSVQGCAQSRCANGIDWQGWRRQTFGFTPTKQTHFPVRFSSRPSLKVSLFLPFGSPFGGWQKKRILLRPPAASDLKKSSNICSPTCMRVAVKSERQACVQELPCCPASPSTRASVLVSLVAQRASRIWVAMHCAGGMLHGRRYLLALGCVQHRIHCRRVAPTLERLLQALLNEG